MMKLVLIVLLAMSAPLIGAPTAMAHEHCEDLPYHTEIVCRAWAAANELIPVSGPLLP